MTMLTISDAEKARRYRRKLIDLTEQILAYGSLQTAENLNAMLAEAQTVRQQLNVEDSFQRRVATGA